MRLPNVDGIPLAAASSAVLMVDSMVKTVLPAVSSQTDSAIPDNVATNAVSYWYRVSHELRLLQHPEPCPRVSARKMGL